MLLCPRWPPAPSFFSICGTPVCAKGSADISLRDDSSDHPVLSPTPLSQHTWFFWTGPLREVCTPPSQHLLYYAALLVTNASPPVNCQHTEAVSFISRTQAPQRTGPKRARVGGKERAGREEGLESASDRAQSQQLCENLNSEINLSEIGLSISDIPGSWKHLALQERNPIVHLCVAVTVGVYRTVFNLVDKSLSTKVRL